MGIFDSNSSNTTNNFDNRVVVGNGSNYVKDGGSINNWVTDYGAIDGALSITDGALSLAGQALTGNRAVINSSYNFAGDTVAAALSANAASESKAFNFAGDALAFSQSSQAAAMSSQRQALEVASGSMDSALAYGGRQTAVALDSLNSSANMVKNAYADAKGRGAMTDYLLMGAIALAGLVAYSAVKH